MFNLIFLFLLLQNGLNTFDLKGKNQTLIVPNSKFTVPSVHQLLNSYFKLVLSHWSNNNVSFNCNATNQTNGMDQSKHAIDLSIESDLAELPQLCLFRPDVHIRTNEEMLDAISNHRWNLLALSDFVLSHNFKNEISQSKTFVEQALLACIVQGAGRPLVVLHRLIQSGLDLNSVFDPQTRCSIIVLAVRLGQHHAVQAFLDAGCRPNSIESRITQRTILGMAIAAGDVDMTNILVLGGANFYEVSVSSCFCYFEFIEKNMNTSRLEFCILFVSFKYFYKSIISLLISFVSILTYNN